MEMLAIFIGTSILLAIILVVLLVLLSIAPQQDSDAMPPTYEEVTQIKNHITDEPSVADTPAPKKRRGRPKKPNASSTVPL